MGESNKKELKVEQAAIELGLKPRQVRNLFYDGKLPGRYLSERRIVIFDSSIKEYQKRLDKEKGIGLRHLTLFPQKE